MRERSTMRSSGIFRKVKKTSGTIFVSSARAFSSSPILLSRSVELRSLKGYGFDEDSWIAYDREIGHTYSRPAGSATY